MQIVPSTSQALKNICNISLNFLFILFFKDFIYLILERRREREREGEKHQCVVASQVSPTGDLACNPGMCPDWESNRRPFGLQARVQYTEPHQPGQNFYYFKAKEK